MATLTAEIKTVLDINFDMIVLATKNLGVKENEFENRLPEILTEVNRMQLETYNKLTTRKDLMQNATSVMSAKVYHVNGIKRSLEKLS